MSVRSQRRREQKGVNEVQHEKGRERTHAEKAEEELLFCLTSTRASCDL